jgi:hypothetical protein
MNTPLRFTLLLIVLLGACAPAPTPAPTSTSAVAITVSPVEVVDKFYKIINEAQTETEVLAAYNLFTNEAMCSPKIAANCDTSKFQNKWWQVKVTYKLYDCGDNVVIAEETRYPRDPSAPSTPAAPKFSRFKLAPTEDGLLIDDISPAQAPGDGCSLAIESQK